MQDSGKKIFMLIDGSAIIHRAYHAMPPFTKKDGTPTGAVYGFSSMLVKLLQNIHPDYIAVAFDRGKPTFRQEMFVGYHSNRPKATDDFKMQYQAVRDLVTMLSIPFYEVDGFEADDIIGTINAKVNAEHKDTLMYVVTGDRDMLQLVDEDTKVLMPVKGISEVMLYDSARVKEKFGVSPDQIIDLKAFMGDPSDNYPGVPGVGPKTASQLLQEYDHFENVFSHISEIEARNPKLAMKLAEGSDQAFLAKKLAALDTKVPFVFSFDDCDVKNLSKEKFITAFDSFEFHSLQKRLDDVFEKNDNAKNQMKLI
jgi:DNA polymerase-1